MSAQYNEGHSIELCPHIAIESTYVRGNTASQVGIMDFPVWWNRHAFFKKYGERRIDTGDVAYVDYALLLTVWEALVWDKQSRASFAQNPRSQQQKTVEAMRQLETRLKSTSWVIVHSYE